MTADAHVHYRVTVPVEFPSGLAPGAGREAGNSRVLSLDGCGRHVIRGSALAGALRNAWCGAGHGDPANWFGRALSDVDDFGAESPLRTQDVVLDPGTDGTPEIRMHNSIDRHTGAAREGGLFAVQSLPPGTSGTIELELGSVDPGAPAFLAQLVGLLDAGLVLGGSGSRGIGRARLKGAARIRRYDLDTDEDLEAWLERSWADRAGESSVDEGEILEPAPAAEILRIDLTLGVVRGQDLCVGGGAELDHQIEPQRVVAANGEEFVRIPGSSLRGVLRSWMTRLASREGLEVSDSAARFQQRRRPMTGAELGSGGLEGEERGRITEALEQDPATLDEHVRCPIMRLFGSVFSASRIHVEDALAAVSEPTAAIQRRMHVAVDSISGGTNDGLLFDHGALIEDSPFPVTITIRSPREEEVRWLAQSLRALHVGLVRVGCSKSSGRLEVVQGPNASGPHADLLERLSDELEAGR